MMREVFRQQHGRPDDVVLAFYSEHRETLLEFASAYHGLGSELGDVVALEFVLPPPGGRSSAKKLLREIPKKADTFFTSPPEKMIGIVMHLRGGFFFPRFQSEAGLHVLKDKEGRHVCLIESAPPPVTGYNPPAGIERQGAIVGRGAPACRTYDREKSVVQDTVLGERFWTITSVRGCVTELTEQRLSRAIEESTT